MPLLVKVSKHGCGMLRFCVPKDISTKYQWSKKTSFMVYAYDDRVFVVEPTKDFTLTTSFSPNTEDVNKVYYLIPCEGYKVFSFYVPNEIRDKLNLENVKLFAVHESGDQAIFLEAFPYGSKTR